MLEGLNSAAAGMAAQQQRIDAVANDLDPKTSTAAPTFRVSSMTLAGK